MMELELTTLVVLALAGCIGFVVAGRLAKKRGRSIEDLQREQDAIVSGERRLFTFLHALGAAIAEDNREATLHRLIVEGALKVTGAKGGALYVYDASREQLVPKYCSDGVAPAIEISEKLLAQELANPGSLLSTLRWQVVAKGDGLLGSIFGSQKAEHISELSADARVAHGDNVHQKGVTLMVGPLSSGRRKLGVLVITATSGEQTFTQNDFEVFSSLVEQSAFALAHAMTHQEVMSKRQLEKELETASEVQRILLPESDPPLDGWVIAGRNRAARILSGDFYEYVQPDAQHFGAVIADVSGKGFPAALVAATARSAIQAHAQTSLSPSSVLGSVNRQVAPDIRGDMFVSMIYMVLEQGGNGITLARAGHPNPLWWHAKTGEVEEVNSPGLGVGIDDGDVFERVTKNCSIQLEPGDVLLLYTDGVDEAMDKEGDEFGKDRIRESLAKSSRRGATAVVDELVEALNAFVGGKASHDDVTLIALQKK